MRIPGIQRISVSVWGIKKLPCAFAEGSLSIQFLGVNSLDDHIFEQNFKCHGMPEAIMDN